MKIHPNIIKHMTLSGFLGGVLLGALYGSLIVLIDGFRALGLVPFGLVFGALFGGLAGLPMGIANGVLMQRMLNSNQLTDDAKRKACYRITLGIVPLTVIILSILGFGFNLFLVLFPAIIATGASLLAVERYFAHHPLDSRKRKRKETSP